MYLCVAPFLVANDHEGDAIDRGQAADHGRVVQAGPVAMQLDKLVADVEHDVQERWPVGMPGHLQPLYRRQPRVRVLPQLQPPKETYSIYELIVSVLWLLE